ncbi:hypothetical protein [Streptomyces justiciae]|uniref:hypothetical protein n=1 Tax=Streptomyces justiciae TaxID=2780140 RepID=UPI0021196BE3|nr:hypothetical protein [Streptomyces justiciae]MCW8383577.1 hypothetical protein [Streptomyces justiciae]
MATPSHPRAQPQNHRFQALPAPTQVCAGLRIRGFQPPRAVTFAIAAASVTASRASYGTRPLPLGPPTSPRLRRIFDPAEVRINPSTP